MSRLRSAMAQIAAFIMMLLTLRPGRNRRPFVKVAGKPLFKGGPATKYAQLAPISASRFGGFSTVLCLSSVSTPIFFLRVLKALGARIFVNQNGVYYPAWFPVGWERKNAYLKSLNELADHVFFQSEFALRSYARWVGDPPARRSLLYNPVDTSIFFPRDGADELLVRVLVFMDVSEFTRPVWEHVLGFRAQFLLEGFEWVYVGRVLDVKIAQRLGIAPVEGDVPSLLRGCDVAFHLVYNDVCPNKVLECMASGVWVIGTSAGGTSELLGDAGAVLPVREDYGAPEYPTFEAMGEALLEFTKNKKEFRARAAARARNFEIQTWLSTIEAPRS